MTNRCGVYKLNHFFWFTLSYTISNHIIMSYVRTFMSTNHGITTSSPFFSKSSMFSLTELPPTSKPHLSDGWWSDNWEKTANIWPASSLVGATTRDPISCFRKGVSLLKRISKMGIPKAIVLPDPVVASTHTSCWVEKLNNDSREESWVNLAESYHIYSDRNRVVVSFKTTQSSQLQYSNDTDCTSKSSWKHQGDRCGIRWTLFETNQMRRDWLTDRRHKSRGQEYRW